MMARANAISSIRFRRRVVPRSSGMTAKLHEAASTSRIIPPISGFTLIEVLLATAIATGLLLVAILFYRQTADLRSQVLGQADRYAQIRLVLDRLSADLRTARAHAGDPDAFSGNGTAIRFERAAWTGLAPGATASLLVGGSDLTQVTIAAIQSLDGTNLTVTGLDRIEEPLALRKGRGATSETGSPSIATQSGVSRSGSGRSGGAFENGLGNAPSRPADPLSDSIRFVRFRYWDGAGWMDGWTNFSPPPGVEITLSCEAPVEGTNVSEYSSEMFRRVVFLPGGEGVRQPGLDIPGSAIAP